jgi:hypothetical protein
LSEARSYPRHSCPRPCLCSLLGLVVRRAITNRLAGELGATGGDCTVGSSLDTGDSLDGALRIDGSASVVAIAPEAVKRLQRAFG